MYSVVSSLEELSEANLDSEPGFPHRVPLKATRENQFFYITEDAFNKADFGFLRKML